MKYTLHTLPINRGPFNCQPARAIDLEDDCILCNDVTLPFDFNPHNTSLWVIGNEFGAVCAIWAQNEQDAFDGLIDQGRGDSFLVSEEDRKEASEAMLDEWACLGDAGEPCDLTHAWICKVAFDPARDCQLLCAFAEARGAGRETLWK